MDFLGRPSLFRGSRQEFEQGRSPVSVPNRPLPPSGAHKYSNEIPESYLAAWANLSGPERTWFRYRSLNILLQIILWMAFAPFLVILWITKNFTSKTAPQGLKIISGALIALFVLGLFA